MDNDNLYKECVNGGGGLSQYISWLCGDKVRDIIVCNNFLCNMLCVVFDVYSLQRPLHDVLSFRKEINDITIDIALQWYMFPFSYLSFVTLSKILLISSGVVVCTRYADGCSDTVLGYANGIKTVDGGTHMDGLKASITRTMNSLAKKFKLVKV